MRGAYFTSGVPVALLFLPTYIDLPDSIYSVFLKIAFVPLAR